MEEGLDVALLVFQVRQGLPPRDLAAILTAWSHELVGKRFERLASHAIVGTVDFGHGVRPHRPVFGPRDGLLYVTTELDQTVSIIDPAALKIVGSVPTGAAESHMLAISSDGRRGYTANVKGGSVSVLDLAARRLVTVIPVAPVVQRIALSADNRWAFTADQTKLRLVVIDTTTNSIATSIPLPGLAFGTAATPEQLRSYIANLHGFYGISGEYDFRTGDQHGLGDDATVMLQYDPVHQNFFPVSAPGGTPLRNR